MINNKLYSLSIVLGVTILSGCATIAPETPLKPANSIAYSDFLKSQSLLNSDNVDNRWWQAFGDPLLDRLVEQARENNLDLAIAQSRIAEARANRKAEIAAYGPRVDLGASATGQRLSETSTLPAGRVPGFESENAIYDASFDASWEIDLFGRNNARRDRTDARLALTEFEERDALVAVAAEIARNYLELRLAQQEQSLITANIARQAEMLGMTRTRKTYGEASNFEIEQEKAALANLQAQLPAKIAQERGSMYRLDVLTGQPPATWQDKLAVPVAIPDIPSVASVGLTSDLLRRRADVRIAEANYVIADSSKRISDLALYPTFSIFGGGGPETTDLGDLFDPKSLALNIGAMLSWTLFDGGKRQAEKEASTERQTQAELSYRKAVLEALEEVENYAARFAETARETTNREQALQSTETLESHSQRRFDAGTANRFDVLRAQSASADAELSKIASQAQNLINLVSLHKALGGGWENSRSSASLPEEEGN